MWVQRRSYIGGTRIFFRIALCDESLINMINTNFSMMQHHQWSLTELDNMIPWERDVYVALLVKHVTEENERTKQQNQK